MGSKINQVIDELRAVGKENYAQIYRNHGAQEADIFGVSHGDLKKLVKIYKKDHELAVALWETGNHDAKILGMFLADPAKATSEQLDAWISDCVDYMDVDALCSYINKTGYVREKAEAWHESDDEWIGTAGWSLIGSLAGNGQITDDAYFKPYLDIIERDIHTRKNRVRYAMNMALIQFGARNAETAPVAIDVANKIGEVYVDHLQTSCDTPNAADYIVKTRQHLERKQKA